jgi:hypothetical protein
MCGTGIFSTATTTAPAPKPVLLATTMYLWNANKQWSITAYCRWSVLWRICFVYGKKKDLY